MINYTYICIYIFIYINQKNTYKKYISKLVNTKIAKYKKSQ